MYIEMEFLMELVLSAILMALLYEKPEFLVRFSNGTLGKLVAVIGIILISQSHGLTAGLLFAIIIIVLRHTWLEGLASISDKKSEKDEKKKDEKGEKVTGDETIVATTVEVVEVVEVVPVATPTDSKQPKCAGLSCKPLKKSVGKEPYVSKMDQLNISEQFRPKTNDIQ
jgi:hypothetical protein